jgi:hypothetical protein
MNDARIHPSGSLLLWFGLLGGPVVWTAQLLLNWSLTEGGCSPHYLGFLSVTSIRLVILLSGVVAVVVAIAAGVASYLAWRQTIEDKVRREDVTEPRRFLALCGIFLNGLFTLAILFTTAPVLVLPCE